MSSSAFKKRTLWGAPSAVSLSSTVSVSGFPSERTRRARAHADADGQTRMLRRKARCQCTVSCMALGSRDTGTGHAEAGLYLFAQGKHSPGLDYGNLFFIPQILKHRNGRGRRARGPTRRQRCAWRAELRAASPTAHHPPPPPPPPPLQRGRPLKAEGSQPRAGPGLGTFRGVPPSH